MSHDLEQRILDLEKRIERLELVMKQSPEAALEQATRDGLYWQTRERPRSDWCPANTCAANPNYAQL